MQYYPLKRRIEVAVGDRGCGIRTSLEGAGFELSSDIDAIRRAVETDASCTGQRNRGAGLLGLRQQMCRPGIDGRVTVVSGFGIVDYRGENSNAVELPWNFPGTMVVFEFAT